MKEFELYISYISWGDGGKNRPVLIYLLTGGKVFVYPITTQYDSKSSAVKANFFKIDDWEQSGLNKQSYIDTGTLFPFPETVLKNKKPIGTLTESDKQKLKEFLQQSI